MEKRQPSYTVGGNANWYSHYGEQCGDSLNNWEQNCHAAAAAKLLQSCPTLCNPIDDSPPGSRPWDSPGKNTGVGCHCLLH